MTVKAFFFQGGRGKVALSALCHLCFKFFYLIVFVVFKASKVFEHHESDSDRHLT